MAHTVSDDGIDIVVQQACVQQFADNERQAACCGEVVHVGFTVGVHADEQRDDGRNFVEVVPVQNHACGTRHGNEVHGVVGRAAGCHQANQGVDEGFFGQHFAQRFDGAVFDAACEVSGGVAGQGFAQVGIRMDEGGGGQVYAHHFHHHLVGVCRAVESAGAGAVVRAHFAFEQGVAADFAFGEKLAGAGFFFIADTTGHRACGDEDAGNMTERKRANHQTRYDFVAHTHKQAAVEHLVRQADGGTHGNHVAGEQRQFHTGIALRDAVAHGGRTAGDLGGCTVFLRFVFNLVGEVFKRLVCGNHVVVGGDDA